MLCQVADCLTRRTRTTFRTVRLVVVVFLPDDDES